jgi:tRNA/rRNA methyltransferase
MGLGGLTVVAPQRLWPEPMRRLASRHGEPVLEGMRVAHTLEEALADCVAAAATTARVGRNRGRLASPRRAAGRLLEWAAQGPVGLVFGPEDRGLSTGELDACFISICIPTTDQASLNLAQAVVVLAYELRSAALEAPPAGAGDRGSPPRPASMAELHGLHRHLKEALTALGALRADNPDHFYRPFKAVLERAGLTSREVRAWRGLARQALWLRGQLKDHS